MAGNIKTDRGKFRSQHFVLRPFFEIRQRLIGRFRSGRSSAKQSVLAARFSRWRRCAFSMARSITANICERRAPSVSMAPDLIRLSRTRLFSKSESM